jgi:hypothetical protein
MAESSGRGLGHARSHPNAWAEKPEDIFGSLPASASSQAMIAKIPLPLSRHIARRYAVA